MFDIQLVRMMMLREYDDGNDEVMLMSLRTDGYVG